MYTKTHLKSVTSNRIKSHKILYGLTVALIFMAFISCDQKSSINKSRITYKTKKDNSVTNNTLHKSRIAGETPRVNQGEPMIKTSMIKIKPLEKGSNQDGEGNALAEKGITQSNTVSPASSSDYDPLTNDIARFFAGKDLSKQSRLYDWSQKKNYSAYKKHNGDLWKLFQASNIEKIIKWRKANLPRNTNNTVFYPFSGPDVINMLAFFPDAKDYILFGLEEPGIVPEPLKLTYTKAHSGLWQLAKAIRTILKVNFFVTKNMIRNLGDRSFSGIAGVMMYFLAKLDYEVLDVKKIWINSKSQIVRDNKSLNEKAYIPGIEILFRKDKASHIQRLRYFKVDVENKMLKLYPNFIPYIESQTPFTTIIKSASYLMHNYILFTKIRDTITSKSDYILQDDSGVPLKHFLNDNWKLSYYGYYKRPVHIFNGRVQRKLRENMKKHSKGPLPFSYGYTYRKGRSNLVLAQKLTKTK
ncbi:MAG TPA: hypothetical protein ENI73_10515 [Spirochaetes bacterium]|nr:hypothetical protein [Spirochaetota bacterium]